jgi:hypothetical protein
MPVLAIGADKSFGTAIVDEPCFVATDMTSGVISNAGALDDGDQPAAAIAATRASSTRNSDEINGSGQQRDLGYQACDFIH